MQVNSRGRAALREAHGMLSKRMGPCKGQTRGCSTLSASRLTRFKRRWVSRKAAHPRLLKLVLSGPRVGRFPER